MADLHITKRGLLGESSGPCVCECIPEMLEMSDHYQLRFQVTSPDFAGPDGNNTFELSDDYTIVP